jgi:hypothetical protein
MDNKLLTVEDVATKLNVSPSWVYSHAEDLGVYHLGKYLRFAWEHVLYCLERNSAMLLISKSHQSLGNFEDPETRSY